MEGGLDESHKVFTPWLLAGLLPDFLVVHNEPRRKRLQPCHKLPICLQFRGVVFQSSVLAIQKRRCMPNVGDRVSNTVANGIGMIALIEDAIPAGVTLGPRNFE